MSVYYRSPKVLVDAADSVRCLRHVTTLLRGSYTVTDRKQLVIRMKV